MSVRIVKVDSRNYAVQVLKEVKNKKDGTTKQEWQDDGYFGHRLESAAKFALLKAIPNDSVITQSVIDDAIKRICEGVAV